ncbi:TonB family protein [Sulfurovum sp. zt1-1]|uniref:TonB family protein n=1 Tax=Sulfurovum zhangzhouensis TaxID=3019067 RepID=A0ABT7QVA5_9BACT|nr:energy transducer TonB [Sulfurovum zhangzhouensis]MDM5270718.1 TonB family protein [Sulfurovum zhangzhouensis]
MNFKELKIPEPQSQSQKISLNLKSFVPPAPKPKPVTKPVTPEPAVTPPPTVQPEIKPEDIPEPVKKEKKSVEKSFITAKDTEENNATKVSKTKPTEVKKPKVTVNKQEPKVFKKQPVKQMVRNKPARISKDPLANTLMSSGNSLVPAPKKDNFVDHMVSRIYGKEFYTYNKEQQKFIKQHLGEIYRITQNTLWRKGYPDVAVRMQMQGTNIVSFYLHPNGDISDLHLRSAIGYRALDDNTLEVIKTAYKDYPKPEKKTKIMFYVKYTLY